MIPRLGEPFDPNQRYTLRPGAYAILPRAGRVLLTADMTDGPDIQLPGGGIDAGESPMSALHREVMEETGWRIAKPVRFSAFRRFVFMPEYNLWAEKLCAIYVAKPIMRLTDPLEAQHQPLWLTVDAAIEALGNAGDRKVLAHYAGQLSPV